MFALLSLIIIRILLLEIPTHTDSAADGQLEYRLYVAAAAGRVPGRR